MMPRLLLRTGVLLLAAAAPALTAVAECLVIAHRGASGYLPEHTLPAYRLAIQLGADYIEPDLVMTRDGFLVARHERQLGSSTNVAELPRFANRRRTEGSGEKEVTDWFAEDFLLTELQLLRARETRPGVRPGNTAFDGQFAVPELSRIIGLLREESARHGRPIGLYPELKDPAVLRARGLDPERALLAILGAAGLAGPGAPVLIQSFDADSLQRLRARTRLPLVQLVAGLEGPGGAVAPPDFAAIASYANGVGLPKDMILATDPDLVTAARAAGLFVHGWTFRSENEYLPPDRRRGADPAGRGDVEGELAAALDRGMTGFFTDQPDVGRLVCAGRRNNHQATIPTAPTVTTIP